jgi:hypothetical protein
MLHRLAALIFCAAVAACAVVREPIGETPAVTEPGEWDGTWVGEYAVFHVTVLDRQRGALEVSWIDTEEKPRRARILRAEAFVRRAGDMLLLSVRDEDKQLKKEKNGYDFFALSKTGDHAVFWGHSYKCIRALVERGELSGREEGNYLVLDRLDPMQVVTIPSGACSVIEWKEPYTFRRLAKYK